MKIAIFSDIHANLPALLNCLDHAKNLGVQKIICLGDTVGYGPFPNECLDIIKHETISVLGNHDAAIIGKQPLHSFKGTNIDVLTWTKNNITQENLHYLQQAPLTYSEDFWIAAHASPISPHKWTYLKSAAKCREILKQISHKICFVGHTHRPALAPSELGVFKLSPDYQFVINPGSVGQSRDGDLRASYGIFDSSLYEYHHFRIEYNIHETLKGYEKLNIPIRKAKALLNINETRSFFSFLDKFFV
ncbi:metallophosphoesterase [Chloroherpeton thalassium ATCC 35110]|uniref:Metallophosphoesterase n=1 Tax=Chloroherpeton thalassium (strain ATCC 35110 / GB-78) TaxID=517418 RepID=B3QVI0_CHLT3|nr:metallophosphoesterase family protein [Chloroherpeton thalassium]ACF14580.1 metallophosphoesterase [Chloroherpeton thalassium ATCC 35110]